MSTFVKAIIVGCVFSLLAFVIVSLNVPGANLRLATIGSLLGSTYIITYANTAARLAFVLGAWGTAKLS